MINDMEFSAEPQSLDLDGINQALPQSWQNHSMRQYGNSQSADYGIDQRCCTHGFPYRRNVNTGLFDSTIEDLPRTAALLPQEKPLPLKFLYGYDLPLCPALIRAAYHAQIILHIGFRNHIGIRDNAFNQRKIQLICQNFLLQAF